MASTFEQENLSTAHRITAASKPLNQTIKALQPKTPGNNLKTPFRARNDENTIINPGGKATHKDTFATPGPAPRTANRAPLGAKTTNAKAHVFQTPGPATTKGLKSDLTGKKASSTRLTIKKKIHVEPEQSVQVEAPKGREEQGEDDEPDFGYAPPPEVPMPDPPMQFDFDTSYACLRPENFNRGVGEIYFQSPKDENGYSIGLKKMEQQERTSLQRDLDRIARISEDPETGLDDLLGDELDLLLSPPRNPQSSQIIVPKAPQPTIQESNINTLKSRSAAAALSQTTAPRTHTRPQTHLPSVVTAQTTSSKQKRKSTFLIPRDRDTTTAPSIPISHATIGFPKAKKAPSILPRNTHSRVMSSSLRQPLIDPILEHDPCNHDADIESDTWARQKELEIRERRRDRGEGFDDEPIFDFDDEELDRRLSAACYFGDCEDFELDVE